MYICIYIGNNSFQIKLFERFKLSLLYIYFISKSSLVFLHCLNVDDQFYARLTAVQERSHVLINDVHICFYNTWSQHIHTALNNSIYISYKYIL